MVVLQVYLMRGWLKMRKTVNITFNLDDPRDYRIYKQIMLKANKSLSCKIWLDMLFKQLGVYND